MVSFEKGKVNFNGCNLYQICKSCIVVLIFLLTLKSVHFKKILISFKIVVVFNTTSADFVLMSADVVLKTTTILKEKRIAQLSS